MLKKQIWQKKKGACGHKSLNGSHERVFTAHQVATEEVFLKSSLLQLSPLAGRAGTAWRARAAFRTRSQFVPQMTHTRRPVNVCLRWRRTSGAAQRLRSSRGQVSFCMIAVYTFCWIREPKDDPVGFTWS